MRTKRKKKSGLLKIFVLFVVFGLILFAGLKVGRYYFELIGKTAFSKTESAVKDAPVMVDREIKWAKRSNAPAYMKSDYKARPHVNYKGYGINKYKYKANNNFNASTALSKKELRKKMLRKRAEQQRRAFENKIMAKASRRNNTGDLSNARVEIYTTTYCNPCKRAKAYLKSLGVSFVEYNVTKDRAAAIRKEKIRPHCGVPLAIINGHVLLGFSKYSYKKALENK